MRLTSIISALVCVILLAAGVVLVAYLILGRGPEGTATNSGDPAGFNVSEVDTAEETRSEAAGGPEDKTLTITIPKMARIEDDPVPDAEGDDEGALGENAAIHLKGTGFPWEEQANVYLAGHRLGYRTRRASSPSGTSTLWRTATRSSSRTPTARGTRTGSSRSSSWTLRMSG